MVSDRALAASAAAVLAGGNPGVAVVTDPVLDEAVRTGLATR